MMSLRDCRCRTDQRPAEMHALLSAQFCAHNALNRKFAASNASCQYGSLSYAFCISLRHLTNKEETFVRKRMGEFLVTNRKKSFWDEGKRIGIRHSKVRCSNIVDLCSDKCSIVKLFASKYKDLYTSVSSNRADIKDIVSEVSSSISTFNRAL